MKRIALLFLALLGFVPHVRGQFYELGLGGSGTLFHGDVGAVMNAAQGLYGWVPNQPAGQITLRRQYNWHWGTRLNYSAGYLSGVDAWAKDDFKQARDISFRTEISELSYMAEFNYWPYGTGTKNKESFYLFAGLGLTKYSPQGQLDSLWYDLRPLGTEGQQTDLSDQLFYSTTTLTVPFGMGYRRSIHRDFSFTAELGWRRYGSDYIDDTGGYFVDAVALANQRGEVAAYFANPGNVAYSPGLERGNAQSKDWAIFAGLTLFYNLSPRDERCSGF
jgi:hypothetical protein